MYPKVRRGDWSCMRVSVVGVWWRHLVAGCKSHSSGDYNYVTGINYITNIVTSHQHTPATIYPPTPTPNTQEKVWLTGNSCHYFSLSQCHSLLPSSQLRMMLDTLLQSFAAPFLVFCSAAGGGGGDHSWISLGRALGTMLIWTLNPWDIE